MTGSSETEGMVVIDARGMKCPWPALRAARAMREMSSVMIRADDSVAGGELRALAMQHGWAFAVVGPATFRLERPD